MPSGSSTLHFMSLDVQWLPFEKQLIIILVIYIFWQNWSFQSAGTDSAVNLWWGSHISNDDATSERSFYLLESFKMYNFLIHSSFIRMIYFSVSLGSLVDSPTRKMDSLLNTYSDYEDSVYGKLVHLGTLRFPSFMLKYKLTYLHFQASLGVSVSLGFLHHCHMMGG